MVDHMVYFDRRKRENETIFTPLERYLKPWIVKKVSILSYLDDSQKPRDIGRKDM